MILVLIPSLKDTNNYQISLNKMNHESKWNTMRFLFRNHEQEKRSLHPWKNAVLQKVWHLTLARRCGDLFHYNVICNLNIWLIWPLKWIVLAKSIFFSALHAPKNDGKYFVLGYPHSIYDKIWNEMICMLKWEIFCSHILYGKTK